MSKIITFTNVLGFDFFPPKPAVKEVPEWYKNTQEYVYNQGKKIIDPKEAAHTIKKCMPVFDAITAGYILYTQVDVQVSRVDDLPYYTWSDQQAVNFHPLEQAPLHPARNEAPYPKWQNPYAIKTPPGYSVLFTQPMHRESIFTILDGVVDTDTYKAPVNFPFVLNDVKWEGLIPAGTPMAQAIPFKREPWEHKIGSEKERIEQNLIVAKLRTLFFNSYKRQFWSSKQYK
jgi:hypothetical protein